MSNTAFSEGAPETNNITSQGKSARNASARLVGFIFQKISSLNSHAMQKALRAQTED